MPSTRTPVKVSPGQGELLSGTRPDPHFEVSSGPEVAYGVYVDLQERNEALLSAITWLGRQARSASFREIGNKRAEGGRSTAVKKLESQYNIPGELEEKLEVSETDAKPGMEKATDSKLQEAFGLKQLIENRNRLMLADEDGELVNLSEKNLLDAFQSGASIFDSNGKRVKPGHKEGKAEFESRFAGSNNRGPRDRLKRQLGRQATSIKRIKRNTAQRV